MSKPALRRIVLASVVWFLGASTAAPPGAQTTFTDRAAWEAAAGNHVTIDFEGIAPARGFVPFNDGLTLTGVTFKGAGAGSSGNTLFVTSSVGDVTISAWSSGDMLVATFGFGTQGVPASPPGSISLPGGVTAVGFNYGATCTIFVNPACGGQPWTVRLSTGAVFTIPGSHPPPMAFWGIVSPIPIGSLQIDPTGSVPLLDNFSYQPAAVPTLPLWAILALTTLLTLAGAATIRTRMGGRREQIR
jgi:hypothetical protein